MLIFIYEGLKSLVGEIITAKIESNAKVVKYCYRLWHATFYQFVCQIEGVAQIVTDTPCAKSTALKNQSLRQAPTLHHRNLGTDCVRKIVFY